VKKNIGIILKKYQPKKKTIAILDKNAGKIKCVPNKEDLPLGALIQYFIKNNRSPYFLENIEIIHIPFDVAIDDILFFHHVLETCYNFIPYHCPADQVFELLKYLYLCGNSIKCNNNKKLFLFKLFTILGLYPEGVKFQTPFFHALAITSIDTIISKNLHLNSENKLDAWLHYCMTMHPEFSKFKTINFLYKHRLP